ncbi:MULTISPECIES: Sec-independent protein translocase subunit TatB [unclassified Streptomyces]|uniref:Sec-independent protein translocase subunit TatB n=1 Tax=unclassified Streptomyces TaxID=2593676 RepID=UPI003830B8A5
MFFDIGPLEFVTLIVLAIILIGPDKLPKMVSDATRTLRRIRELSQSAQVSIRSELPPELQDLRIEDLNPKTLIHKNLLAAEALDLATTVTDFDLEVEPFSTPDTKLAITPRAEQPRPTIATSGPSARQTDGPA